MYYMKRFKYPEIKRISSEEYSWKIKERGDSDDINRLQCNY